MSMFGEPVEINLLRENLEKAQGVIKGLESQLRTEREITEKAEQHAKEISWKLSILEKENDLATEKKLHELRKSMQESLIKSDLLRTEALAKLEIYEKTDTKQDANAIKDMIGKLIDQIGKQSNISIVK